MTQNDSRCFQGRKCHKHDEGNFGRGTFGLIQTKSLRSLRNKRRVWWYSKRTFYSYFFVFRWQKLFFEPEWTICPPVVSDSAFKPSLMSPSSCCISLFSLCLNTEEKNNSWISSLTMCDYFTFLLSSSVMNIVSVSLCYISLEAIWWTVTLPQKWFVNVKFHVCTSDSTYSGYSLFLFPCFFCFTQYPICPSLAGNEPVSYFLFSCYSTGLNYLSGSWISG